MLHVPMPDAAMFCMLMVQCLQMSFMCDTLQAGWVEGLLLAVRDAHKVHEKRQQDAEDATCRALGVKKVRLLLCWCWCH